MDVQACNGVSSGALLRAARLAVFSSVVGVSMASTAAAAGIVYRGICEASAAALLDAKHFVVADDNQNVLHVYAFGTAAAVSLGLDLVDYLGTGVGNDGLRKKADLEAAARVGDRIYWMGSHSRDSKGNPEASRQRFFATPVTGGDRPQLAMPSVPPYRDLFKDLAVDARLTAIADAAARKVGPEQVGGLNIEGLAATPDGRLLIGFRNPLIDRNAIVLPIDNPDDMVAGRSKARFGEPMLLDLGNRGIRSIDRADDGHLIVAGPWGQVPAGSAGSDFALFAWSGKPGDRPRRWTNAPIGTLGPEALVPIPGTTSVRLISDDGDRCKAANTPAASRSFRTSVLDLATAAFR